MKTLIVGAGVIGVIYSWALSQAGVDVTHVVRPGKKDQFQGGVTLDVLDERKGHPKKCVTHYSMHCVEAITPADGYELIIVPTNSHQVEGALQALAPVSGAALFLIFTGNWDGLAAIDRWLPRERYLLGYADGGGTIRDGVYWTNIGGEVHLGEVDGTLAGGLERVAALFARADIKADVQPHMLHWLWVHNAGVIGFAAGFAKHRDLTPYLKDSVMLRECILATRELYELCRQRGVDLNEYPEIRFINWPVWLVRALIRWNFRHNESMQRYTAHAASAGSLNETKLTYASVMRSANELNVAMPHTMAVGANL